ncbi:Radical SAM protein [Candidatus Magnetomoraceae bacterium gMMP-15]
MNLPLTMLDIIRFSFGATRPFNGPLKVQIEITHRCNSRCKSCGFWRQKAMDELSIDQWKIVLKDIKKIGTRRVAFGGGEPTLYKGIFDLIKFAKNLGLLVSLGTNGLLLKKYHQIIADSGLDVIEISLDGPPEIHNKNRGLSDAFKRTIEGAAELANHSNGPVIQYNFTPNKINAEYLQEFIDIAVSNHAKIISIEPAHLLNDQLHLVKELFVPGKSIAIFERQMNEILDQYSDLLSPPIEYYRLISEFFKDPLKIEFSKKYRCVSGYSILVLDPGGNVYGCPAKERNLGNITKKSLNKIWLSKKHINDIKRVKQGNHKPCWLNSVSPINMTFNMIKNPAMWKDLFFIAHKEIKRRL